VIRSYNVARRDVDVAVPNRTRTAAASTAATGVCTGMGVPEDLARFELLAALGQDVDEPTAKLRLLLP
jgi:hypothetical protein